MMTAENITKPNQVKGTGRYFFLGMASVVLCLSMFMSIFTPVPLTFAHILYGRARGYLLSILGLVVTAILSQWIFPKEILIVLYFVGILISIAASEVWYRKVAPYKGMVVAGTLMLAFIGIGIFAGVSSLKKPVSFYILEEVQKVSKELNAEREKIVQEGGDESLAMIQFFNKPEAVVQEVIYNFPTFLFIAVFFGLWINLLVMVRSQRMLPLEQEYPYTEKDFFNFTMPDWTLIPLIPALVLAVWGKQYLGVGYELIGFSLLKCLGLFYFFQGFGVYSAFLDYLNIGGFIRSFMVLFTIVTASWIIALVGLFDNWVNFRKWFNRKNKNDEGDLL
jgi:uncharacterized protein YybS (DUF2232 family)